MKKNLTFAVVGGDMRQMHLASLLAADGHDVLAYALDNAPSKEKVVPCFDLGRLSEKVSCVVLPIPVRGAGGRLNAPMSEREIELSSLFSMFPTGQTVIAGKIDNDLFQSAGRSGLRLYDYLEREDFTVYNSISTAEGAIETAMHETARTLHGRRALVIGFGHIGKILSQKLYALGADVTASARKFGDMAWISACGFRSVQTADISESLKDFDIIFNTVPSLILNDEKLDMVPRGTLIIDLASKPGGVDFHAARRRGIKTIHALSLPGKVAPISAAEAMRDTIYNILHEWGIDG